MIKAAIRMCLSFLLLYGVYTETGIFTTIAFALIFAGFEIMAYMATKMLGKQ